MFAWIVYLSIIVPLLNNENYKMLYFCNVGIYFISHPFGSDWVSLLASLQFPIPINLISIEFHWWLTGQRPSDCCKCWWAEAAKRILLLHSSANVLCTRPLHSLAGNGNNWIDEWYSLNAILMQYVMIFPVKQINGNLPSSRFLFHRRPHHSTSTAND